MISVWWVQSTFVRRMHIDRIFRDVYNPSAISKDYS